MSDSNNDLYSNLTSDNITSQPGITVEDSVSNEEHESEYTVHALTLLAEVGNVVTEFAQTFLMCKLCSYMRLVVFMLATDIMLVHKWYLNECGSLSGTTNMIAGKM